MSTSDKDDNDKFRGVGGGENALNYVFFTAPAGHALAAMKTGNTAMRLAAGAAAGVAGGAFGYWEANKGVKQHKELIAERKALRDELTTSKAKLEMIQSAVAEEPKSFVEREQEKRAEPNSKTQER